MSEKSDVSKHVEEFLAKGGKITKCKPESDPKSYSRYITRWKYEDTDDQQLIEKQKEENKEFKAKYKKSKR